MDMLGSLAFYIPAFVLVLLFLTAAIKILREYERGVVFTLGRFTAVKGPGLILLVPYVQQMVRMDLRTVVLDVPTQDRSEEHTSELQSLMRISYAVFCLKKKNSLTKLL